MRNAVAIAALAGTDTVLAAEFQVANLNDFRSCNHGISFNFTVPGSAYFESGILRRNTNFYKGEQLWRSVLMSKPFAGERLRFNLLSLVNGTGVNGTEVFLRPELLWSIDAKGSFQAGLRYEIHRYKIEGQDYSRNSPTLMAKWTMQLSASRQNVSHSASALVALAEAERKRPLRVPCATHCIAHGWFPAIALLGRWS